MKPYYEQDGIQIFHGDCREILPTLGPVDHVITDPPYGIALQEHGRSGRDWTIPGDADQELGNAVLEAFASRPTVAFASPKKPWAGQWRQHLVWDKGPAVGGGGDLATCWKPTWELIQVRNHRELSGPRDSGVLTFWIGPQNYEFHPAQKPLALMTYLVGKTTDPGETILDPFMGSGTTLRAAKDLGRKAIGIEISERWCEVAAKRMSQSVLPLYEGWADNGWMVKSGYVEEK